MRRTNKTERIEYTMSKRLYILEIRKIKTPTADKLPNKVDSVIGIFTKPKKAVKWIKKNRDWFGDPEDKKIQKKISKRFFALLEVKRLDSGESVLYSFYDFNGEPF